MDLSVAVRSRDDSWSSERLAAVVPWKGEDWVRPCIGKNILSLVSVANTLVNSIQWMVTEDVLGPALC